MGAHALGAAGDGAKAAAPAAGGDGEGAVRAWASRQIATMNDAVAIALASLPQLRTSGAGPLGPGRLSSGHVGLAVRVVQAHMTRR